MAALELAVYHGYRQIFSMRYIKQKLRFLTMCIDVVPSGENNVTAWCHSEFVLHSSVGRA